VSDTIATVDNESSGTSCRVKRHDCLNGDIGVLDIESLKHDGNHLFSILLRVTGRFSEKATLYLSWVHSQLVVESMVPDLLHVVPGLNDTGVDWVGEVEDTFLLISFFTNVKVFLAGTVNGLLVLRSTHDSWEYGSWSLFSGETGLDHS